MQFRSICAALVCAVAADAFRDTSPFFAFSTSSLISFNSEQAQLQRSSEVTSNILAALKGCPSNVYVLVSQSDVSLEDFGSKDATPHLRNHMQRKEKAVKSTLIVPEVLGNVNMDAVQGYIQDNCHAQTMNVDAETYRFSSNESFPQILRVEFPALPTSTNERMSKLAEHDSFLNAILTSMSDEYTVFFATTPPSSMAKQQPSQPFDYDLEQPFAAMHTDLKRDLYIRAASNSSNGTHGSNNTAPLFEKYNFFSPGIFMGLLAIVILFSILSIGLSALSSLEVSYGSFTKEMNPTSQKKQQ